MKSYQVNNQQNRQINLWTIYCICLLISAIFFSIFGFNSPIYKFNTDHDFQWFMTMGNGLANGKIPYRDLFEQKGPIVYFVTAFASLFPNPNLIILIIEIVSLSLFFFFAYRICRKYLNDLYALIAIPVLAFAIFTCWCRMFSAAAVEEFALPIYAYFLLCWLEFLTEKKSWNCTRSLCLGLCFGIILWVKFTLVYFMIAPMIIWLIISIRRRQFKTILFNALCMIAGVLIVSVPILLFYALHHAIDDLFYVYFYINLTAYGSTTPIMILSSFGLVFAIGPVVLFLILWGVIRFAVKNWKEISGKILLTAFLINVALLVYSSRNIVYYYGGLIPYAIIGVADFLKLISNKLHIVNHFKKIYTAIIAGLILLCIPCSILTYEWGRNKNEYIPLVVADIIQEYEEEHNTKASLFCYKFWDFGFYNAAGIIPNNYFFANNVFKKENFPELYESFNRYITQQTSDFIITEVKTWNNEKNLLAQYYQPYTSDLSTSTYHYRKVHDFYYRSFDFVLLIKK